ncbi:ABC transporter permease [Pontivivens insulae]|uniref:2-aminoethylphosphonate transport system permease protein PhnU n=1 Tax=Pontivivens insulae TaxID=1639689 RepID=A0A2R8AE56_9RHOB|nr:iron ABC transporter permease [Pontivivens insulae]RED14395.1 iron(III) transport system permease protein [Pontivivens insulae]SPF30472.1 Putative 2-aminoethylphosphonate transport system permease protein PhnU [Pontivivens insulae]
MGGRILNVMALVMAALCVAPMIAAVFAALAGDLATWNMLSATVLPRYIGTTLLLVVLVAMGTAVVGTGAAWLVTLYRFPGVRWLEIALALPLAFPAYVLAYAYTDFLDFPGPVQTLLRETFDWGRRDYWFPEVRSTGGAAVMLIVCLYPYVYLLARAAFRQQSVSAYLAARTLGRGPIRAFLTVSLPIARPAIAGGVALTVMETISDYGTVSYFGVQTFSTGIYQAWFSMGDRAAAAQLALCLLSFALLLAAIERIQRGQAQAHMRGGNRGFAGMESEHLRGVWGWVAAGFCLLPVLIGFILPIILLTEMAIGSGQSLLAPRYRAFMANSITLATIAALVTTFGALMIAFRARLHPGRRSDTIKLIATLGYAVPGGVIAVGLLVPFAVLDNRIDAFMEGRFGIDTGLLFTGSIWLLVLAYAARFMAAALSAVDSGMVQVPPNVDAVTRTLGRGPLRLLAQVHLPILRGSVLTALLIVFVDVMKELPATLIMRPFNFDTLAVQAHRLASDERLSQAAVPSLVIVACGLLPVILVCHSIDRSSRARAAARPDAALAAK